METEKVAVKGNWLVHAKREDLYSIFSNWEKMPEHFPKVAKSVKILEQNGTHLKVQAIAGSFASFLPGAKIDIDVELLPGRGYRCQTFNKTFNTTGDEELLLIDDPTGTRIQYTYFVTVHHRKWKWLYAWLVRTFGLPFWKRAVIDRVPYLITSRRTGN
jgi:hypothetical protein